jgi:A/G-specific adenine glycosylase
MAARDRVKRPDLAKLLIEWYGAGHRDLPWRRTADPYHIWVSEIMLQQTRAQAVIPYYERFLARFPTVRSLAASEEEEVLALWSGLGYYSRARNLRRAAVEIAAAGGFPRSYEEIRALPGIGDYTAAAIASIAFGMPHAVLDGNVLRVVARVENDAADTGSARTRERFRTAAQSWLDPQRAGAFNQALMELGATVCLPRNPLCLVCPLRDCCRARVEGTAAQLPVKLRKTEPVRIAGVLLVVRDRGRILLRRRDAGARRMAGFWELPGVDELPGARASRSLGEIRHTITHHHYTFEVKSARGRAAGPMFRWFEPTELNAIPLSTTARKGLRLAGIG